MKRDKVYISGKISGLDINLVDIKFKMAEDLLISKGFEVVNPRKIDHSANTAEDWSEYMRVDLIEMLKDCNKIYYLDCWQNSTGAVIEFELARWIGFTTLHYKDVIAMPNVLKGCTGDCNIFAGCLLNECKTCGWHDG